MCVLSGVVVGAPTVVNAACAHIGLEHLSFVVGGAFAAYLLCLPCASLVSSSVLCFLVAVGWSGFVRAFIFELIKIAHTCWQTSILFSVYYVLIFLWDTPLLPPSSPWRTHPGLF